MFIRKNYIFTYRTKRLTYYSPKAIQHLKRPEAAQKYAFHDLRIKKFLDRFFQIGRVICHPLPQYYLIGSRPLQILSHKPTICPMLL